VTDLKINAPVDNGMFKISEAARKQFNADLFNAEKMPLGNPQRNSSNLPRYE
jgi:hypothetical protein